MERIANHAITIATIRAHRRGTSISEDGRAVHVLVSRLRNRSEEKNGHLSRVRLIN